ncbi:MAG: cobyrinate a,c-diamide synthase [Ruminococcus sp.]|nr:cobyrinate a,c-diamide synthase [Ruminococcus sp.]
MKRILIGGTHSGCGKTTVTCAVLQALCRRKMKAASFKCGPDYIDPLFHEKIIGTASYNLDSFFCDDNTLKYLLYENGKDADIAVIEGVMGFYDGAGKRGSANSVSQITGTKAVVVIDCKGMSGSIGAVMKGFLEFEENNIAGFIFNRLPEKLVPMAMELCDRLGTEYFGYLPVNRSVIKSRHLGLVTADEISDLREKMQLLAELAEEHILLDRIIELSDTGYPGFEPPVIKKQSFSREPVIAVSKDKAFCFLYQDNIKLLKELGCEIRYFSPLSDSVVPEADGLILCGGYPELYGGQLEANQSMLYDIYRKIKDGIPVIAECGGFMYLHDELEDENGNIRKLVGAVKGRAYRTERLQRFGYVTLTALSDNLLCYKDESFKAHEFHYWDSTDCGSGFNAEKSDGRQWSCGHTGSSFYAGFPHLYFYSDIKTAEKFVSECAVYGGIHEQNR